MNLNNNYSKTTIQKVQNNTTVLKNNSGSIFAI